MYISSFSNNQRNLTFGYKIYKHVYGDPENHYDEGITILSCAQKIEREQGTAERNRYLAEVQHFSEKRFDGSGIVKEYWDKIRPLSESAKKKFRDVFYGMYFEESEKESNMPWENHDITKIDAKVYKYGDYSLDFDHKNTLYSDFGVSWLDLFKKEQRQDENTEELLGSTEGIKKLEGIIDKGIETRLRAKFDAIIEEEKASQKDTDLKKRRKNIHHLLEKMGVEATEPPSTILVNGQYLL